jgi:hypothetical protein
MKIDLDDVLFWMDAIRDSSDKYRTLESFWKGQIYSKTWLVKSLEEMNLYNAGHVVIHGGWYGVLASLLFNSNINVKKITSIDIDPDCEKIAFTMNKRYEIAGKFKAITADMCDYVYDANVVINTCCEHITQEQYDKWLNNVPDGALIVLQGNNYFDHPEHIRCSTNLNEFVNISNIKSLWASEMELPKYKRFMMIGKKHLT